MKPRSKWKQELIIIPCGVYFYLNFLSTVFSTPIIWTTSSEDISRTKRIPVYREARRVESDDLVKLSKVLRSVDEEEMPAVKSIETALQSIEEENAIRETRKRSKIAKVLADIEDHTKKALSNTTSKEPLTKHTKTSHLWPENIPKKKEGGRTVTIDTVEGKKKVFIPKGWIFCTISPVHCYSAKNKKRREVTKRNIKIKMKTKPKPI